MKKALMEKIEAILNSKAVNEADDELETGASPEGGEVNPTGDEYNPEGEAGEEGEDLSAWVSGVQDQLSPEVAEEIKSFIQFKIEQTGTSEEGEGEAGEEGTEDIEVEEENWEMTTEDKEEEEEECDEQLNPTQKKIQAKAKIKK